MMLPEHVEQYLQYQDNRGKIKRPIFDEQKLEVINDVLGIAVENYTPVYIDIYKKGVIKTIKCYVSKIDQYTKEIKIVNEDIFEKVKLEYVVDIRIV